MIGTGFAALEAVETLRATVRRRTEILETALAE